MSSLSHTFPQAHRLTTPAHFAAVYEAHMRDTRGPIVVYGLPNELGHARMGLSVSRKVGVAPRRNRIKRMLREAYRSLRHELPGAYDLVLVVRPHEPFALGEYQNILKEAVAKIHAAWTRRSRQKTIVEVPSEQAEP